MIEVKIDTNKIGKEKHDIYDYKAFVVCGKDGGQFLHLVCDQGIVGIGSHSCDFSSAFDTIEDYVQGCFDDVTMVKLYKYSDEFTLSFTEQPDTSHATILY